MTADYDPVAHLNEIFATPGSLAVVSTVASSVREHVTSLDEELRALVASQSISDASSVERVATAKADLEELFQKIEAVRGRATATEQAITAMTADIKRLDATKRNLTVSMTALKRLQMLSMGYDKAKWMLQKANKSIDCSDCI
jgi:vacuolar protein sorting-associated protein 53